MTVVPFCVCQPNPHIPDGLSGSDYYVSFMRKLALLSRTAEIESVITYWIWIGSLFITT